MNELKALKDSAERNRYSFDAPDAGLLESIPSPAREGQDLSLSIEVPEFTSLCLHGSTRVDVACDEEHNPSGIPIRELVGTEGVVFSFDKDSGSPVAQRYRNVRMTRAATPCVDVSFYLFRGSSHARVKEERKITCTPDHLFLVRVGWGSFHWVRAQDLTRDMQLVAHQRTGDTLRGASRHRLVAECLIQSKLSTMDIVHHIDHRHFNNAPENISVTEGAEHFSHHQKARYGYEDRIDRDELLSEYRAGASVHALAVKYGCDDSTIKARLTGPFRSQPEALINKRSAETLSKWKECRELYEQGYTTYELGEYYGVHGVTVGQWIAKAGGVVRSHAPRRDRELPALNHRVIGVVPNGLHDVYCMEVEKTNCFFAEGVVVHNCPITGQPDFAVIEIDYSPRDLLVESKSLKLYLMGYRNHGAFHEAVVCQIHSDLWALLNPHFLRVVGKFTPRGGIPFHPTVSRWATIGETRVNGRFDGGPWDADAVKAE